MYDFGHFLPCLSPANDLLFELFFADTLARYVVKITLSHQRALTQLANDAVLLPVVCMIGVELKKYFMHTKNYKTNEQFRRSKQFKGAFKGNFQPFMTKLSKRPIN